MIRVNGKLYYDTRRESTISEHCENMDGEITSTVDETEIPTEDNQSLNTKKNLNEKINGSLFQFSSFFQNLVDGFSSTVVWEHFSEKGVFL